MNLRQFLGILSLAGATMAMGCVEKKDEGAKADLVTTTTLAQTPASTPAATPVKTPAPTPVVLASIQPGQEVETAIEYGNAYRVQKVVYQLNDNLIALKLTVARVKNDTPGTKIFVHLIAKDGRVMTEMPLEKDSPGMPQEADEQAILAYSINLNRGLPLEQIKGLRFGSHRLPVTKSDPKLFDAPNYHHMITF